MDAMTKTNGYAKRDTEIERLRTVIDECALSLERIAENPEKHHNIRSALLNEVSVLRDSLNYKARP